MADLPARRGMGAMGFRRSGDPFERMQEMLGMDPLADLGRLLGSVAPLVTREAAGFVPDFEVRETPDAFIFKADLPGVDENNIDISIQEGRLTVSGRREEETREENERYYVAERTYGTFTRSFTLPEGVNPDDVQAEFKNGVLTVRIPKRAASQARHIRLGAQRGAQGGAGKQGGAGGTAKS